MASVAPTPVYMSGGRGAGQRGANTPATRHPRFHRQPGNKLQALTMSLSGKLSLVKGGGDAGAHVSLHKQRTRALRSSALLNARARRS